MEQCSQGKSANQFTQGIVLGSLSGSWIGHSWCLSLSRLETPSLFSVTMETNETLYNVFREKVPLKQIIIDHHHNHYVSIEKSYIGASGSFYRQVWVYHII